MAIETLNQGRRTTSSSSSSGQYAGVIVIQVNWIGNYLCFLKHLQIQWTPRDESLHYMWRNIILSSFGKFRDTNQSHLLDWILSSDNPITWLNFFSLLNRPPATSSLLLLLLLCRRAKHTSSIISQQPASVANESVQSKDMSITGQQMANPGCQIPFLCVVGEHTRSATGSWDSPSHPQWHTQTQPENEIARTFVLIKFQHEINCYLCPFCRLQFYSIAYPTTRRRRRTSSSSSGNRIDGGACYCEMDLFIGQIVRDPLNV